MTKQIESLQNPLIKTLITLKEKSRSRKRSGMFLIEGLKEIQLAIQGDYELTILLYNPQIIDKDHVRSLYNRVEIIQLSPEVYKRLAYRDSTQGVIAVAKAKALTLDHITFKTRNPLLLVAEAPEKPGNIGALLRTADAAHVDAVLIANLKTDLYNPNIIRSSVGCVFTNQIAMSSTSQIITFLKKHGISIYCAALTNSAYYNSPNYTKSSAIVVGTESTGLSKDWFEHATQHIKIPMYGKIDSLNVSVAAGILIFEAKRQRQFKP